MSKKAPTLTQMTVIVLFTLSCFGLLLYLWLAFGGPTPLLAKSYQIKVPFPEATQLASQSDVRISGVSVGKVKGLDLTEDGHRTLATVQLEPEFGPMPADTRAIVRAKTLLSEAYVELTPGDPEGPELEDGGILPEAQVVRSIQLDEIMRTFDPDTREAFQTWMQHSAAGIDQQGLAFSNALGNLQPMFSEFDDILRTLDAQGAAVKHLFRDGARSFRALSREPGQLRGMITNFNEVFATTAERNQQIEEMFRAFPTFLDESRATSQRFADFAENADPLMRQLTPAAAELSGTFQQFGRFAPEMEGFVEGAKPVIERAPQAFTSAETLFRDDFPRVLRAIPPFFHGMNPLVETIDQYKRELAGFLGNLSASTQGVTSGLGTHYLRVVPMLSAEGLATFPSRLQFNRNNAYVKPGAYLDVGQGGLRSFHTSHCSSGIRAQLDTSAPSDPDFRARIEPRLRPDLDPDFEVDDFYGRIKEYFFNGAENTDSMPQARCDGQGKFDPIGAPGPATDYPQVLNGRP